MCVSPLILKKKEFFDDVEYSKHKVDCGRCFECLKKKANQWAFRFAQQMKDCNVYKPLFVTLTYDDDSLTYACSEKATLVKKDLQLFHKRLREKERRSGNMLKLIYYSVGEYGSVSERPHYHCLLLNVSNENHVKDCWSYGIVHFGTAEPASIAYTMKYAQKKVTIVDDDRQKEFAVMSKGIGSSYCNSVQVLNFHKKTLDSCVYMPGGIRVSMPRYYKDKIFDEEEVREIRNRNMHRSEKERRRAKKTYEMDNDKTYERKLSEKALNDDLKIKELYRKNRNKI